MYNVKTADACTYQLINCHQIYHQLKLRHVRQFGTNKMHQSACGSSAVPILQHQPKGKEQEWRGEGTEGKKEQGERGYVGKYKGDFLH